MNFILNIIFIYIIRNIYASFHQKVLKFKIYIIDMKDDNERDKKLFF